MDANLFKQKRKMLHPCEWHWGHWQGESFLAIWGSVSDWLYKTYEVSFVPWRASPSSWRSSIPSILIWMRYPPDYHTHCWNLSTNEKRLVKLPTNSPLCHTPSSWDGRGIVSSYSLHVLKICQAHVRDRCVASVGSHLFSFDVPVETSWTITSVTLISWAFLAFHFVILMFSPICFIFRSLPKRLRFFQRQNKPTVVLRIGLHITSGCFVYTI